MAIPGYINIPSTATQGGAPIDAFQGDAFRTNSDLIEKNIGWLLHAAWCANDGSDAAQTHATGGLLDAKKIWRTTSMTISNQWDTVAGFPLIVLSSGTITINALVNAKGMSTPASVGHLGGSGGGGTGSPGFATQLPLSGAQIAAGGASGTGPGNAPADNNHILRLLSLAPTLNGGGAGGNSGGNGGGVVIMVADTITLGSAPAGIDASGGNGGGAGGGGGGGCIVLIARTFNGFPNLTTTPTGTDRINVFGGTGTGAGGAGSRIQFTI